MPRTNEQNNKVREEAKANILKTALGLYVRYGYAGTVMDQVAAEAGIAKGLLYYYYKNKNELFKDLFDRTIDQISAVSENFFKRNMDKNAVYKLVQYSNDIFGMGIENYLLIQFAMRMPFDAYAVFGQEGWEKGTQGSVLHTGNLERIISEGFSEGSMKGTNAQSAAASFWTVYVSGLFNFTKMMSADEKDSSDNLASLEDLLCFAMAGLGVEENIWKPIISELRMEKK